MRHKNCNSLDFDLFKKLLFSHVQSARAINRWGKNKVSKIICYTSPLCLTGLEIISIGAKWLQISEARLKQNE